MSAERVRLRSALRRAGDELIFRIFRRRPINPRGATGAVLALALTSCISVGPGPGRAISWSELPGWGETSLVSAWPALLNSCSKLNAEPSWNAICTEAMSLPSPDEATVRAFFESNFEPHLQRGSLFRSEALITGYYEPLLYGNTTRTERFRYPIYGPPKDLLTIDLGALYPEFKNKRLRGRLNGKQVVPYYSRAEIDGERSPLVGNEFVWVDDPIALFFLQIQGSGRVQLPSGDTLLVGYADQNGHPYTAIGRTLVERAGLRIEDIDAPTIRRWLAEHPSDAQAIMNTNASYVFFVSRDPTLPGPVGALNVPLLPERAIAVDPVYIPLGVPVWLDTVLPDATASYRQLVFAQDTGGAIRGPLRADLFFGYGPQAETYAGRMRSPGRLYVLLPAQPKKSTAG